MDRSPTVHPSVPSVRPSHWPQKTSLASWEPPRGRPSSRILVDLAQSEVDGKLARKRLRASFGHRTSSLACSALALGLLTVVAGGAHCRPTPAPVTPTFSEEELAQAPTVAAPKGPAGKPGARTSGQWQVLTDVSALGEEGAPYESVSPLFVFSSAGEVVVRRKVIAPRVIMFADSLAIEEQGSIVTANRTEPSPPPGKPTTEGDGANGEHGQPGVPGRPGGDITLVLTSAESLEESLRSRNGDEPAFDLRGQDGGDGQQGGDGRNAPDQHEVNPGNKNLRFYSKSTHPESFAEGRERAKGVSGDTGGSAGNGGDGGTGGMPGRLTVFVRSSSLPSAELLERTSNLAPGEPGDGGGPGDVVGKGGRGTMGYTYTERHCWKTLFWTDCKDTKRGGRGREGDRGADGQPGTQGSKPLPPAVVPSKHVIAQAVQDQRSEDADAPMKAGDDPLPVKVEVATEMTPILRDYVERASLLALDALHSESATVVQEAISFENLYSKTISSEHGVLDGVYLQLLERMKLYSDLGLSTIGQPRRPANWVPSVPYQRIEDVSHMAFSGALSVRDEVDWIEGLVAEERSARATAEKLLPVFEEKLRRTATELVVLEQEIVDGRDKLAAAEAEMTEAQEALDEARDEWFADEAARSSEAQTDAYRRASQAELLRGLGGLALAAGPLAGGVGIAIGTGLNFAADIGSRAVLGDPLLQFSDLARIPQAVELHNAAKKQHESREKRLKEMQAQGADARTIFWHLQKLAVEAEPYTNAVKTAVGEIKAAQDLRSRLEKELSEIPDGDMPQSVKDRIADLREPAKRYEIALSESQALGAARLGLISSRIAMSTAVRLMRADASTLVSAEMMVPFLADYQQLLLHDLGALDQALRATKAYARATPVPSARAGVATTGGKDSFLNAVTDFVHSVSRDVITPPPSPSEGRVDAFVQQLSLEEQLTLASEGEVIVLVAPRLPQRRKKVYAVSLPSTAEGRFEVTKLSDQWLEGDDGLVRYQMEPATFGVLSSIQRRRATRPAAHNPSLIGAWRVRTVEHPGGLQSSGVADTTRRRRARRREEQGAHSLEAVTFEFTYAPSD